MPSPGFVFGFIIATLIGAVFHVIFGGDARRLALFLIAGWLGFAIGQFLGVLLEVELFTVGELRMMSAAGGALLLCLVAQILTAGQARQIRQSRLERRRSR